MINALIESLIKHGSKELPFPGPCSCVNKATLLRALVGLYYLNVFIFPKMSASGRVFFYFRNEPAVILCLQEKMW